jgi:tRNA nucleotidyltransferase (CCA-adding enzyme)
MKQAVTPSIFFDFLRQVNWLGYFFKELEDLIGVQQSAVHHPEGDAYTHTMLCVNQANDYFTRIVMLCHDLGKAVTTTISDSGKISAIGHEAAGVPLALAMMQRIHLLDYKFQNKVCTLVQLHMIHTQQISEKVIRRTLRILTEAGLTYSHLVEVCRCDVSGRTLPPFTPNIGQERATELLEQGLMTPVVTGKLLLSLGLKPSKELGTIINKALELQDKGTLNSSNWFQVLKGCGFNLIQ